MVMRQACAEDPLFLLNAFTWTYNPRLPQAKKRPFIAYPFQEDLMVHVIDAINSFKPEADHGHDLGIDKSRDQGVSYIILFVYMHHWLFLPHNTLCCVSRTEDLVDKLGDSKSLFWKLCDMLQSLPPWLMPRGFNWRTNRSKLRLENPENGSLILGESTTGDVGRGGRATAYLMDEFASFNERGAGTDQAAWAATSATTDCRIAVSTHKGAGTLFYELKEKGDIPWETSHWSQHPVKSKGIYQTADGILTSPWRDREVKRAANKMEIAQEIDCDPLKADAQFFDEDVLIEHMQLFAREPMHVGHLEYDPSTGEFYRFVAGDTGPIRLWVNLDEQGKVLPRRCAIGADIATGTQDATGRGYSNSTASVVDLDKGEKIAEVATQGMQADLFARLVVALCWMFSDRKGLPAYLAWEKNGPGGVFGNTVVHDLKFTNVFFMRDESTLSRTANLDVPGWYSNPQNKLGTLSVYARDMREGSFINRSREALKECRFYVYTTDGKVEHANAVKTNDPSGARANHGDRVIADALACKLFEMRGRKREPPKVEERVPLDSFEKRRQDYVDGLRRKTMW